MSRRSGTLIVKTSDFSLDVVLRDQLRALSTTDLAPVHIASGDHGRLAEVSRREGVQAHALPLSRDPSPAEDVRALLELIRLMRRLRPELVVYGTPKATLLAGIAAVCTRVPARVQVLHGLRLETTTGVARQLLLATERLALLLSTSTIAVSHGVRRRCAELGLPVADMTVLGSGSVVGIDTARARRLSADPAVRRRMRTALDAGPDELVVGYVGRITRDKGVEVLVRAVARARDHGLPIRLAMIGPDEGIDALDDDVRRLLAEPWVTCTGNVPDPAEYYTAFDAFCIPSFREGLSTVLLEAWAAGVPTIVSDCTGLGDVVDDRSTGMVVPVRDVVRTAAALEEVLGDAALRAALRERALRRVEDDFSREVVWARCAAFYRTARDNGRRRLGRRPPR
ncbi:glycosyltransferase [Curtobacterium sp. VKM Ac-2922]|uniref:glycosyltransferase n=1 Tax=Curtobacterium sp. VKM Ac-2922 TaxID=2929475 RepID=UPI001FB4F036|nr:glycosyltransferase [Curtobacterium sp. VKM Ac-2922]MCJ1714079.1 glycosyltransferase [Curtobacterium sp. VKM Ac-2922]